MKFKTLIPVVAAFAVAPFVSAASDSEAVPENVPAPAAERKITPEQRRLFLQGLGWLVGQQSGLSQELRISAEDVPAVTEGFRLALLGEGKDFPEKIIEMNDAYSEFIEELQRKAQEAVAAEMRAAAEGNRRLGEEYVAKTLEEDKGFEKLPSGVLMKTLAAGDAGKKPTLEDTISVRDTGRLIDGTIFDSSARSDETGVPEPFVAGEGEAVELPLGGLIKAWGETLPKLGLGGRCTLVVPADQGYGDRAVGIIPPGSTPVFDIELAGIVSPDADAPADDDEE